MVNKSQQAHQSGFTLIELMLATAFFTFILLFVTMGFMQISRSYTRGVTTKRVHEEGRALLEQFNREIRVSRDPGNFEVNTAGNIRSYCFKGFYELIYMPNPDAEDSPDPSLNQIYVDGNPFDCSTTLTDATPLVDREQLAIQYFEITPVNGTALFTIKIALSTGDYATDLLDASTIGNADVACDPSKQGNQYCDVVYLEKTVALRK